MKPDSATEIVQELRSQGHEAYLVGGCVRDMVMGIEPADYDIATSALPEQITKIFPRTESIGAQFGVVLVIYKGRAFEVATFRSDEAYVDGRRPTGVVFTDAKQDVLRRDFTINGLLYDPFEERVIDYVNGQADIQAKLVRAIGDPRARFEEDKLRILRAVRFGARLGYTIEPATWEAVRAMAPKIHQVSSERIREELHHLVALLENLPKFHQVRQMSTSSFKRFFRLVRFDDHLELARIHAAAAGEDVEDYNYVLRKRQEWTDEDIAPKPLISGEDLIAIGFMPGPVFKEILTRVEDQQLEGRLTDSAGALDFVRRHYGKS